MPDSKLTRNLAISESGFLFLPTTGETFTVNETGRLVLQAMQSGKSDAEVLQLIADEFDVDRTLAERDVQDFLAQLKQYKLLNGDA
jgi:hypothetical protein